jgi:uncharacterized cysteine cluster protein YcgN (CxxCxxCC family)
MDRADSMKTAKKPVSGAAAGRGAPARLAGTTLPPGAKPAPTGEPLPFWKTKTLEQMSQREWESLCDGCGRCCLNKLEDIDTGETHFTDVGCKLLDTQACRCKDYKNRQRKVPDCVKLTPRGVRRIVWLPPSCAYKLVAEGRDLYWWHPLVSGDPETVHTSGASVRGRVTLDETQVPDDELENHIVAWPGRVPKAARPKKA